MEDLEILFEKLAQYEQREKELTSRIEELSDFLENGAVPLHWVDENGIIIWANQAELLSIGYSKEEYIGYPISNFYADKEVITDILMRLASNETLYNYQARLKCKDGTIKDVLVSSNVYRKEGKFIHTRCFTRDVTNIVNEEKRKVEMLMQLEKNEAQLKIAQKKSAMLAAIVESSDDAIISKTLNSIITSWNHSAERTFGYTADEMLGESILKLIPPDRADEEPQILARLKRGDRVEHFETKRLTKDKRLLDVSLTISPVKDLQGTIIGLSKIVRDISEKKQAEQLIRDREEHLRLAIKAAELGTFDIDVLQGTMTWDTRCRELFGIYKNNAVTYDHDFLTGLHKDDREKIHTITQDVLYKSESDGNYNVEYRTIGIEDKRLRWIRAMGKVFFDEKNNPVRFIGTVMDITNQKQEELRKNDFVAIVSHELKTPLTVMQSYVQVLLAKAKKEADSFGIQALSRTEIQTKKMTSMIENFLILARLGEGELQLKEEVFDLHALLSEITEDARFLTSSHTVLLNNSDHILLKADKEKIGQVMINLIGNAIKYSSAGSRITIGYEKVEEKVKIYVKDEGIGISLNDQKKLFGRFYRVENEKVKTVAGFGIGLYLVSEILNRHNSKIEIESAESVGSTFYFYLATQ